MNEQESDGIQEQLLENLEVKDCVPNAGPEAETLFLSNKKEESISGTPISQWSSLLFEAPIENKNRLLYSQGLYDPGSGNVCTKFLGISNSAVLLHPYFNFPVVTNPGIRDALIETEDEKPYEDNGQELYLDLCKKMEVIPVHQFHDSLLKSSIDLSYYGVNPDSIRAMCMALKYNMTVEDFILVDNWLNKDACYHLGRLLIDNKNLKSLNLTGCRIGPEGVRRLCDRLVYNRVLQSLDLTYNHLGDKGTKIFSELLQGNKTLKRLNLSHNSIGVKAAIELGNTLECGNYLTHLNLSWNNLFSPHAIFFLRVLSESIHLEEIDLSWNSMGGPQIGTGVKALLYIPTLKMLNISHNRFFGEAIKEISSGLNKAKKMMTLNLSFNPLSETDAYTVLHCFQKPAVKIKNLLLDCIWVNRDFVELLKNLHTQPRREDLAVTYEGVHKDYSTPAIDMRNILLRRIEYLVTKKPKKNKKDFGQFIMILQTEKNLIGTDDFTTLVEHGGMGRDINNDIIIEIALAFPGPPAGKVMRIDLKAMVDYIKQIWPWTELPPPPTPPPPVEEKPKSPKKKTKGKGKRKK